MTSSIGLSLFSIKNVPMLFLTSVFKLLNAFDVLNAIIENKISFPGWKTWPPCHDNPMIMARNMVVVISWWWHGRHVPYHGNHVSWLDDYDWPWPMTYSWYGHYVFNLFKYSRKANFCQNIVSFSLDDPSEISCKNLARFVLIIDSLQEQSSVASTEKCCNNLARTFKKLPKNFQGNVWSTYFFKFVWYLIFLQHLMVHLTGLRGNCTFKLPSQQNWRKITPKYCTGFYDVPTINSSFDKTYIMAFHVFKI